LQEDEMKSILTRLLILTPLVTSMTCLLADEPIVSSPELPRTMPWNLAKLSEPPKMKWLDQEGSVRSLLYTGEPFHGKPTQVFAWYATPATLSGAKDNQGPWPAVVLVHGGGGTAFAEWVKLWAKRGYAAIAMDLAGTRPDPNTTNTKKNVIRLEDGGPDQGHPAKFNTITTEDITDDWPYHAVANVILAHSLLRTMPGVDKNRTAITGISWGGYTTCLVASLDNRFKAAVPVYGCGFLHENSTWLNEFKQLGPEQTKRWVQLYDPSSYLPACRVPIYFVNGTNDFAYPLDSYLKCYNQVTHTPKNIRIQVKMPHGHEVGWAPLEIGAFIDSYLADGPPLPALQVPTEKNGMAVSVVKTKTPLSTASLAYTTDDGPINKLEWKTSEATVSNTSGTTLTAILPENVRIYFFTATTSDGLQVSSPVTIKAAAK
jgi:dienelactone hydrolase